MYTQCAFPPRLIEFSSPFFATRRAKIWRRPGHLSNCTFWTFFVFSDAESVCTDCIGVSPPWLLYLCIAFGILFLVMLIINVFLCSAMTCSCARTDTMEKEPSIIEEFDPYTRSWQGSQYGSRFSLNGNIKPIPPPLISVDTSHSISSSSECGIPAVYGLPVHSRPSSRYSNRSTHKRGHQHSAASSSGSTAHYSKYSNGHQIYHHK